MRSRLRCVKGCAAMAAPLHVPAIARTPHGADGPTTVAVLVAVRAARRRHDNPTPLGVYEVTDEVVRKLVARRFSHGDVLPETADKEPNLCRHLVQCVGLVEKVRSGPVLGDEFNVSPGKTMDHPNTGRAPVVAA